MNFLCSYIEFYWPSNDPRCSCKVIALTTIHGGSWKNWYEIKKKEEIHHMEYKFRQMGFNLKISIPFIFSKISN